MNIPNNLYYTKEHEWVLIEGNKGKVGITDYAQSHLGDITYVELPQAGKEVKQFDNPDIPTQIRLQLARTKKKLGRYTTARDLYIEILKEKNMTLDVQVEAAMLYQDWAAFPGKEALYQKAIIGAEPDPETGKNIIWFYKWNNYRSSLDCNLLGTSRYISPGYKQ